MAKTDDFDFDELEEADDPVEDIEALPDSFDDDADEDIEPIEEDGEIVDEPLDDLDSDPLDDLDADGGDDEDSFDSVDADEPAVPRGTHYMTYVLAVLNIAAAIGFAILLVQNLDRRRKWTYSTFLHDLAIQGLPLEKEKDGASGSRFVGPRHQIDGEKLKKAFQNRATKQLAEKFISMDEVFDHRIQPQHITQNVQQQWFANIGSPVTTLEAEVRNVEDVVFKNIDDSAQAVADLLKDDQGKEYAMRVLLYPLAFTVQQIEHLENAIVNTPDKTAFLKDAVKRRVLHDILYVLDHHRSADLRDKTLEQMVEFKLPPKEVQKAKVPEHVTKEKIRTIENQPFIAKPTTKDYVVQLSQLETLLKQRFAAALSTQYDPKLHYGENGYAGVQRSSTEMRKTIATLLFTLGQTKLPGADPKGDPNAALKRTRDLLPFGLTRVQGVIGLYEYALAFARMTQAVSSVKQRYLTAIRTDRDGDHVKVPNPAGGDELYKKLPGFIDDYEDLVEKIRDTRKAIKRHEAWFKEALAQEAELKTIYSKRVKTFHDITQKILVRRNKTAELMVQLRKLQQRLFVAQVALANANEINIRLEQQIRELEYQLQKKLGQKVKAK